MPLSLTLELTDAKSIHRCHDHLPNFTQNSTLFLIINTEAAPLIEISKSLQMLHMQAHTLFLQSSFIHPLIFKDSQA